MTQTANWTKLGWFRMTDRTAFCTNKTDKPFSLFSCQLWQKISHWITRELISIQDILKFIHYILQRIKKITWSVGYQYVIFCHDWERNIFQTFWKHESCTDFLFLELDTSNFGYLLIFFPLTVQSFSKIGQHWY